MFSTRRLRYLFRRALRALGRATGTAHQIALGVAIGFFVAWLPIMGIQMLVAIALCTIFRANKLVPIFPVWITNPVTFVPVYSLNYWVGWLLVGGPPLSNLAAMLVRMISIPDPGPGIGRFEAWWDGLKYSMGELLSMGWDMQLPLWLGSVIVGLTLAIPSYCLSYRFVEMFRQAVEAKRRRRNALRRRGGGGGVETAMSRGYRGEE